MRKRIYEIIELSADNDRASLIYDYFMMFVIIASILPLAFKTQTSALFVLDKICLFIFIIDYILRLITADFKLHSHDKKSFLQYPFTPMAIVDLISILPSITILNHGFKLFRMFRLIRTLRVFKIFRYSKSVNRIAVVFRRERPALLAVCTLAGAYIAISALVIFNVEPETFSTFFDAIYWATISLTTVGYGDIYPVTAIGRVITMFSSIFGVAIIALPAGILTAGYMEVLTEEHQAEK